MMVVVMMMMMSVMFCFEEVERIRTHGIQRTKVHEEAS